MALSCLKKSRCGNRAVSGAGSRYRQLGLAMYNSSKTVLYEIQLIHDPNAFTAE